MATEATQPDRELLLAARAGDRDAFGDFYVRYREHVVTYFLRRTRNPELAADLTAELFASTLGHVLSKKALPDEPARWLFTVARNLLVDSVRRGHVEAKARQRMQFAVLELDDGDIEEINELAASADRLESLRHHLSEAEWEAVRARVVDEEPYPDLARRLQCSEAVARKRVSRGLTHLRTSLGGTGV